MTCKEQIDATGFKGLINHLQNNPDIHTIIQVFDADLAEVGEEFKKDEVSDKLKEWKAQKQIVVYAYNEGDGININSALQIVPDSQAVDCLYLPPFYLFKDRKQEWK